MAKKKSFFSTTLFSLIMLIPTLLSAMYRLIAIIDYEAHLAQKNMIRLCLLFLFFTIVLASTWVGLSILAFRYLLSFGWSIEASLGILIACHALILVIILLSMKKAQRNLSFPETRGIILSFLGKKPVE